MWKFWPTKRAERGNLGHTKKIHEKLTVRAGGVNSTVSLTVNYPCFFTTSLYNYDVKDSLTGFFSGRGLKSEPRNSSIHLPMAITTQPARGTFQMKWAQQSSTRSGYRFGHKACWDLEQLLWPKLTPEIGSDPLHSTHNLPTHFRVRGLRRFRQFWPNLQN